MIGITRLDDIALDIRARCGDPTDITNRVQGRVGMELLASGPDYFAEWLDWYPSGTKEPDCKSGVYYGFAGSNPAQSTIYFTGGDE